MSSTISSLIITASSTISCLGSDIMGNSTGVSGTGSTSGGGGIGS